MSVKRLLKLCYFKVKRILYTFLPGLVSPVRQVFLSDMRGASGGEGRFREVYPREVLPRTDPVALAADAGCRDILLNKYKAVSEPAYVWVSACAGVYGRHGIAVDGRDNLVIDAFIDRRFVNSGYDCDFIRPLVRHGHTRVTGRGAVLTSCNSDNYFHWMFDVLPKCHLIKKAGFDADVFLFNGVGTDFQIDSLDMLGIVKRRFVGAGHLVGFDELAVPSLPGVSGNMPVWAVRFLRSALIGNASASGGRRIFISRRNTAARRIVNEEELIGLLANYGFETHVLESMSFSDQIELFRSARVVVSPHGAGNSNYLFCDPGAVVLELFPCNNVEPCFFNLASVNGLQYHYYVSDIDWPGPSGRKARDTEHIHADLKIVETFLRKLGDWPTPHSVGANAGSVRNPAARRQ